MHRRLSLISKKLKEHAFFMKEPGKEKWYFGQLFEIPLDF
jgi:hypothetical protein